MRDGEACMCTHDHIVNHNQFAEQGPQKIAIGPLRASIQSMDAEIFDTETERQKDDPLTL